MGLEAGSLSALEALFPMLIFSFLLRSAESEQISTDMCSGLKCAACGLSSKGLSPPELLQPSYVPRFLSPAAQYNREDLERQATSLYVHVPRRVKHLIAVVLEFPVGPLHVLRSKSPQTPSQRFFVTKESPGGGSKGPFSSELNKLRLAFIQQKVWFRLTVSNSHIKSQH